MQPVRIVTDSTADIPDELVEELQIGIIYDYINYGAQSLRDKIDISRQEFYSRLAQDSELPTTASPGVGEFSELYRRLGAPEVSIVALHPPQQFSALYGTAVLAAESFPQGTVTVIDTGQVSMGMGWQVICAARAARDQASPAEIVKVVADVKPRVRLFAALSTFEFLRKSGRVSWARSVVGTLLQIKPLIELREGQPLPLDRIRTERRAMARLVELTESVAPLESLAIMHSDLPQGAKDLRRRLTHLRPRDEILIVDVTPVIGVHVGPKGLGVATVSKESPLPATGDG
jgi:DegV family protein with EDD domain